VQNIQQIQVTYSNMDLRQNQHIVCNHVIIKRKPFIMELSLSLEDICHLLPKHPFLLFRPKLLIIQKLESKKI